MSYWNNLKQSWKRLNSNPQFKSLISSPITKIVGINTAIFLLWRIKGVSETFLVKHLSYERFNIRENRFHTMITYAFSHFGFFSYLIDMVVFASFARGIKMQFGNRVIWWLYLVGALAGGLSMHFGMPNMPTVVPQVGSEAPITALITFYGLFNLHNTVLFFVFPMKMWVLLAMMGVYSLMEPSKKNIGGIFAGLLIYQLFKIKVI